MRPFQIVVIGIFGALAVIGLITLSLIKGGGGSSDANPYGESVVVWGTFDKRVMEKLFIDIAENDKPFSVVRYEEKNPETFDLDLLNAIAENRPPDLIILKHDALVTHRTKLFPLDFKTISERQFRDTYIDGADIFLRPDGIYGIPLVVDPLVMYWNRDMISSAGLAGPPKTWEELVSVTVPSITRTDSGLNILRSALAFGEYTNVSHAKKILSMLFLQSGTDIIIEQDGNYVVTLGETSGSVLPPSEAALAFYVQFAIPANKNYSWNRSQSRDTLQFLAGDLALYFAPGGEYLDLERQNPNLNFDVATVPQGVGASILRNYGDFYALAIPRTSRNVAGAYNAALTIGSEAVVSRIATDLKLAPAYRSVIAQGTSDSIQNVLYRSVLIAHGWLDPNPKGTESVFKTMVEDITSGRELAKESVSDAVGRLQLLFR